MANHSLPTLTSTYTNFLTEMGSRIDDAVKQGRSDTVTLTNPPVGAIRWNATSKIWEQNTGTVATPAWTALATSYGFSITGDAGSVNSKTLGTFTAAGGILYATSTSAAAAIAAGTSGQVLLSGAAGAPTWANQSTLAVGSATSATSATTATNLAGGVAGAIPYQSGAGASAFSAAGTTGQVLTSAGTAAPTWTSQSSLSVGTATSVSGGSANVTTLTASGAVTLNGATASTIPYLNASKVMAYDANFTYTATGLGIGTSSPGAKLSVSGVTSGLVGQFVGTSGSGTLISLDQPSVANWRIGQPAGVDAFAFYGFAGGTYPERMRLDASGNLGLGVTPSAWTNYKAFEIGALGSALLGISGSTVTTQNAYWQSGAWKYAANGYANRFEVGAGTGQFQWFISSSNAGGAGAALTFTQAMTLDANANLISGGTGYWQLPSGTTAQRPAGSAGQIRFNTSLSRYEGHNGSAWAAIGGGAGGGGTDQVFYENGQTVTTNYSITSGKNAMSAGPITVSTGITVTVPSGSFWTIV